MSQVKLTGYKFVTNQMNLGTIATMGIIASNCQLIDYTQDSLALKPGFIPLFKKVPEALCDFSTTHFAKACIVHLNTISIDSNRVFVLKDEQWCQVATQKDITHAKCLLVMAPLPITVIKTVSFVNEEHKVGYERFVTGMLNVLPLKTCVNDADFVSSSSSKSKNYSIDMTDFDKLVSGNIPPADCNIRWQFANGLAGVLSYLSYIGNSKIIAGRFLLELLGQKQMEYGTMLADIAKWFRSGGQYTTNTKENETFLLLLEAFTKTKTEHYLGSAYDIVLDMLKNIAEQSQSSLSFLEDLKNLTKLSDKSLTQLLAENKQKSVRKAILLFFTQPSVEAIWQYPNEYVEDLDRVLATILFATSTGWQQQSIALKVYANNDKPISELIATVVGGDLSFSETILKNYQLPLMAILTKDTLSEREEKLFNFLDSYFKLGAINYEIHLPSDYMIQAKANSLVAKGKTKPKMMMNLNKELMLSYLGELNETDLSTLLDDKKFLSILGKQ